MKELKYFELLQWHDGAASKPDTDTTVALWSDQDGLIAGWWDDERREWMECSTGAAVIGITHWADAKGPLQGVAASADVPADQVRAALAEALDQLRGWVAFKCAKKHQAEHLAVIATLARAGGLQ